MSGAASGLGSGSAGASATSAGGDVRWHRFHPVTPVLKSWRVLVVLLAVYARERTQDVAQHAGSDRPGSLELLLTIGGLVVVVLVSVAVSALTWRVTTYAIDAEAVRLHSGLLRRRQRAARLDRIQAVDVVQPVLARLFGFAEVKVDVAGGSGSGIRLGYLREADAQALRATLLARSAGLAYSGETAPQADDASVVEVPLGRVAASLALSTPTVVLVALLAALVVTSVLTGGAGPALGTFPLLVALAGGLYTGFVSTGSWRVAVAGDGLRVRHGLMATSTQTVLPGRVQAVRLVQPVLWRPAGWWRVQVNVAGVGRRDESGRRRGESSILLPVGTRAEAEAVLAVVLRTGRGSAAAPGADGALDPASGAALAAGLTGASGRRPGGDWVVAPRRTRWLDPIGWSRHGALVTPAALWLRRGRLRRQLDVVPHERTQSLGLRQGPLQRRLAVAHLELHSTRGPVRPQVRHLDAVQAGELLAEQARRARRARALAGPERWMERPAASSPDVHASPVAPSAEGSGRGAG